MNAYEEGFNAYFQHKSIDDNPYKYDTDSYEEWEEGYVDAEFNEEYEYDLTDF